MFTAVPTWPAVNKEPSAAPTPAPLAAIRTGEAFPDQHRRHVPPLPIPHHGKQAPVSIPSMRLERDAAGDQDRHAGPGGAGLPNLPRASAVHLRRIQAHDADPLPAALERVAVYHPASILRDGRAESGSEDHAEGRHRQSDHAGGIGGAWWPAA